MAIKVKKKDQSRDSDGIEEADGVDGAEVDEDGPVNVFVPESGYKLKKGNWAEENPQALVGIVVALVLAVLGAYYGMEYVEAQNVKRSAELTPAFNAYNKFVKGSAQLEAIEANPNLEAPKDTLESEEARWTTIYDSASATLKSGGETEIADAARVTKAAAAMRLGKHDEAITLYEAALTKAKTATAKAPLYEGLANAQAAQKKYDDAIATYEQMATLGDDFAKAVKYPRARMLELAGKKDKAKELYHDIIENDPTHPQKTDIERRLATL